MVLEDVAFEDVVTRAADAAGARALHFEGTGGFPIASLLRLTRRERPVILSIHDFSAFCLRPHLVEQPAGAFCGYCEDMARCAACLRRSWPVDDEFQRRYRQAAAALLERAAAIVYPSPFLRDAHARLFDGVKTRDVCAVPPSPLTTFAPREWPTPSRRQIALVGAVHAHKGALIFEDVVRTLAREQGGDLHFHVFGGGDPVCLRRLRALPGVHVHGYYRAGTLGASLREHGIGLALALSITPESYALTVDECLAAAVPVLAFDHGAVGERLASTGGGLLAELSSGVAGVVDAIRSFLDARTTVAPLRAPLPTADSVVQAYTQLYREIGIELLSS
jgi:glycosyltransferase involved in cell wall biosynthesis